MSFRVSKLLYCKCSLTFEVLLVICCTAQYISSSPLPPSTNMYSQFMNYLNQNKCFMPSEIRVPFLPSTDPTPAPFEYLSSPLKLCQDSEIINTDARAYMLCSEIFDVIESITCHLNMPLSEIEVELSNDTCNDFTSLQGVIPKTKDYLGERLTDDVVCRVMCVNEYESACKVLLWNYNVQNQIQRELADSNPLAANANPQLAVADHAAVEKKNEDNTQQNELDSEGLSINRKLIPEQKNKLTVAKKTEVVEPNMKDPTLKETKEVKALVGIQDADAVNNNANMTSLQTAQNRTIPASNVPTDKHQTDNKIHSDIDRTKLEHHSTTLTMITNGQPLLKNNTVIKHDSENEHTNEIANDKTKEHPKSELGANRNNEINDKPMDNVNSKNQNVDKDQIGTLNGGKSGNDKQNQTMDSIKKNQNVVKGQITVDKNTITVGMPVDEHLNITQKSQVSEKDSKVPNSVVAVNQNVDKEEQNKGQENGKNEQNIKYSVGPNSLSADTTKGTSEPISDVTTLEAPLENMEGGEIPNPAGRDPDQYKSSLYQPLKNKESDSTPAKSANVPNGAIVNTNDFSRNFDGFPPRNNIGRVSDEIQVIPSFPEQEDSHFFFYFLSIVLILMAGYLVFHNKQKIIALIVEGRHERRRRSHGVGYKKLETK